MPLHIALVVKIDEFPTVIVHNDQVSWLRPDAEARWRKEWDKDDGDPPGAVADQRFNEDRAAQHFIQYVDMPVKRVPLAMVEQWPKRAMAEVWAVYDRANNGRNRVRLFSDEIEKSGSDVFQHDLDFVKQLEAERKWYDAVMVPFWNDRCHGLWLQHAKDMDEWAGRLRYQKALNDALMPVKESYLEEVRKPRNNFRVKERALASPPPRVTDGGHLAVAAERDIGTLSGIDGHLQDVGDRKLKVVPPPPFHGRGWFPAALEIGLFAAEKISSRSN